MVKNLPASAGGTGLIPGLGRSLGEGKDNLLPYSCLENPMDSTAWWATVHQVLVGRVRHLDGTHLVFIVLDVKTGGLPQEEKLTGQRCCNKLTA